MPKKIQSDNQQFIARLKNLKTLDRFDDADLHAMLEVSKIIQYDPGDYIIREEEFDNRIYFLITGEVQVIKNNEAMKILHQTGDIFGEMGIIEGVARSASIVAQKKTVVLALDAAFVEHLKQQDGKNILDQIFTEALADRLRATTDELAHTQKDLSVLKNQNSHLKSLIINLKTLSIKSEELIKETESELGISLSTESE